MIDITKKFINYNYNKGGNEKKYIVVHDTGNYRVGASAINHYKYFNGGYRGASAHYFIDDKMILQVVEDNDISWHSGVKYGLRPPRKEVNNYNSIGIEMCVNHDGDYEKAFNNTIKLTKYLMEKYNISENDVVRHYDACLKICPQSMSENNWEKWNEFKKLIAQKEEIVKPSVIVEEETFLFENEEVTVNRILFENQNYVKVRDLEKFDLSVTWDNEKRLVVISKK